MIFDKLQIENKLLKNRIVVPPLVVFGLEDDGTDQVQDAHIRHYSELSMGGAGLIIVESITTWPVHERRTMISAYDDRFLDGLTRLANACKQNNTVALAQITNTGLELMPYSSLREMPSDELQKTLDKFVISAVNCKKAGFDGVELHAAHGFYLNQILELNDRDDEYGDGNEVLANLIRRIKESCGKDFIVDVRMGNHDMEALIESAKSAEAAGADLLHISRGAWSDGDDSLSKHEEKAKLLHSPQPLERLPEDFKYEYTVYMASGVKKNVGIPVICVGGIKKAAQAEDILIRGYADLIALGRQQLADPNWTNKVQRGIEPDYCIDCKACKWMIDGTGSKCAARIIAKRRAAVK